MLNQIVLVGRLARDVEIKELESGKKVANITLAVSRPFKNKEGIYETDFIDCTLWEGIATNTAEYCNKGDILGVKGRLQTRIENDKKYTEVIADKVTFLSSKKEDDKDE